VQRDAEELRLDDKVLRERSRQLLLLEPRQAGPEPDVRRLGPLRLDRAEPFDRLLHAELAAFEQELPREQRAVELTPGEDALADRATLARL